VENDVDLVRSAARPELNRLQNRGQFAAAVALQPGDGDQGLWIHRVGSTANNIDNHDKRSE
jgi:hypothetical protein